MVRKGRVLFSRGAQLSGRLHRTVLFKDGKADDFLHRNSHATFRDVWLPTLQKQTQK
jgi:hypothetical protein